MTFFLVCFTVYDVNNDGYISRDEMVLLLKKSLFSKVAADEDPEEGIKDLVELVFRMMVLAFFDLLSVIFQYL